MNLLRITSYIILFASFIFSSSDKFSIECTKLDKVQNVNDQKANKSREKRQITSKFAKRWSMPQNISYIIRNNLSRKAKNVIESAIEQWETNTCIRFIFNGSTKPMIRFIRKNVCCSRVGRLSGEDTQDIGISPKCQTIGNIGHEIGHTLGFFHEHSRPDRDNYITVNFDNIFESDWENFAKNSEMDFSTHYDYGSIMHYASNSTFAIDFTKPTIITKDKFYQQIIGQRIKPSFLDFFDINQFYCKDKCLDFDTTTLCKNNGYPNPNNCKKCLCPSGFAGEFCDNRPNVNEQCGNTLNATKDWQILSSQVGTNNDNNQKTVCYWHIQSPIGTNVRVKIISMNGTCSIACNLAYLELKMQGNFQLSGYRQCCSTPEIINHEFASSTNLVPIIAYGKQRINFTIEYRIDKINN